MATQKRTVQDRRAAARIKTRLSCHFTYKETRYEASIRDIALGGALLHSKFTPPFGADISVKIKTPQMSRPLLLEARIVRRDCNLTDRGTAGAFAVRFSNSSPEFITLIRKLGSPQR